MVAESHIKLMIPFPSIGTIGHILGQNARSPFRNAMVAAVSAIEKMKDSVEGPDMADSGRPRIVSRADAQRLQARHVDRHPNEGADVGSAEARCASSLRRMDD
jgi:hypothetical protein